MQSFFDSRIFLFLVNWFLPVFFNTSFPKKLATKTIRAGSFFEKITTSTRQIGLPDVLVERRNHRQECNRYYWCLTKDHSTTLPVHARCLQHPTPHDLGLAQLFTWTNCVHTDRYNPNLVYNMRQSTIRLISSTHPQVSTPKA
jgi:hypothetical protein